MRTPLAASSFVVVTAVSMLGCSSDSTTGPGPAAPADSGTETSTSPEMSMDAGMVAVMDAEVAPVDAGVDDCPFRPARMIVLGDSVAACFGVGGKDGPRCAPKRLHTYLQDTYAPGLTYENVSVGGAVVVDVADSQVNDVAPGPGHLLVVINVGGNDLARYLFASDDRAQMEFLRLRPEAVMNFTRAMDYFRDTTRFPDGVTFLVNNQYNPFDECTAPPYRLSQVKSDLLRQFNAAVEEFDTNNDDVYVADQFTPFLGHGHHHDVMTCPHYVAGHEDWMEDLIHANAFGHLSFFEEWKKILDPIYSACN